MAAETVQSAATTCSVAIILWDGYWINLPDQKWPWPPIVKGIQDYLHSSSTNTSISLCAHFMNLLHNNNINRLSGISPHFLSESIWPCRDMSWCVAECHHLKLKDFTKNISMQINPKGFFWGKISCLSWSHYIVWLFMKYHQLIRSESLTLIVTGCC